MHFPRYRSGGVEQRTWYNEYWSLYESFKEVSMRKIVLSFAGVMAFVFAQSSFAQEYSVSPYSIYSKNKEGHYIAEYRLKIHGFGIEDRGDGEGLDIALGHTFVDTTSLKILVLNENQDLDHLQATDKQIEQIENLKSELVMDLRSLVQQADKKKGGSLFNGKEKELRVEIESKHDEVAKRAYKLFESEQIENWSAYQFFRSFQYTCCGTLSQKKIVDELVIGDDQLAEVRQIENKSKERIESLKAEVRERIEKLKLEAQVKLMEAMDQQQVEMINRLRNGQ
jgi:hypothetical protein